jgi:hypothetical protein
MPFETNVFVNCPFDNTYRPLLRPLLFTIMDLGFEPRIASERLNSAEPRVSKILELIEDSKFGIHDLSRIKASAVGEYYRMNMPFELALDIACALYKGGQWADKKCLILEAAPFEYQAALSDLAGSDIRVHEGKPKLVAAAVRNWLNGETGLGAIGPAALWSRFNDFMADNFDNLTARGFSKTNIRNIDVSELVSEMRAWIAANPA